MSRISFWLILLGPFLLSCGGSKHPSSAVARDFMEAYYVKADLSAASSLSEGLALEKVKSSETLRQGLTIDASAHQPRVSFKLLEGKVEEATATYLYRIEIKPKEAVVIRKKTLLRIREKPVGSWKVTQFTDLED